MKTASLWMWLMGILSLLILATIFLIPLNSDSDIYQAMAVDLAAYGKLPYTASWDHNFPGIVYIHWVGVVLFGNSDIGFRVVDLLANGVVALMLFSLSKRIVGRDVAIFAPLIYALYYVSGGWWAIGQRDVFAGMFLLSAVVMFSRRDQQYAVRSDMSIGFLIGCAAMIRPTYAPLLVLLAIREFRLGSSLLYVAGFSIPILAFVLFFYLAGGDLQDVYTSVIRYNSEAYGGLAEPWSELVHRSTFQWLLLAFGAVGSVIGFKRYRDTVGWGVISGVLTGLVSALVMRKFFVYHFHVLFVFMIPLAMVALAAIFERIHKPALRTASLGVMTMALIVAFYPRHLIGMAVRSPGTVSERVQHVQDQYSLDSLFGRRIDLRLSSYLGEEKNVELITVTPAVHWMNSLDRPSRFTMIHSLTTRGASGKLTDFQEEWRAEYLTALQKRKPKIIALADGPRFLMKYIRRTPKDLALEIEGKNGQPGFAQLLSEQYVLDTTIGGYYIYTRNVP
jgi:hypothetical protein